MNSFFFSYILLIAHLLIKGNGSKAICHLFLTLSFSSISCGWLAKVIAKKNPAEIIYNIFAASFMVKSNWAATFCVAVGCKDYSFSFSFGLVFGFFFRMIFFLCLGQLAYWFKWSVKWFQLEWIIKWLNLLCLLLAMCMEYESSRAYEWLSLYPYCGCHSQILLTFSANFDTFLLLQCYVQKQMCAWCVLLLHLINHTVYTVQFNYLCRCNRRTHQTAWASDRRVWCPLFSSSAEQPK